MENDTDTPKIGNGFVQLIRTDESTRHTWVKLQDSVTFPTGRNCCSDNYFGYYRLLYICSGCEVFKDNTILEQKKYQFVTSHT